MYFLMQSLPHPLSPHSSLSHIVLLLMSLSSSRFPSTHRPTVSSTPISEFLKTSCWHSKPLIPCVSCNTPRFSSRCFTRWLVLCAFRPRGMLVIARRDYLSGFGPKTLISNYSFSLLSKDRNLSSLPHTLKLSSLLLSSSFNPPKLVLDCFACLKLWMSLKIASQHPSSSMLSHHCRVV